MDMGAKAVPVAERIFGEGSYLRPNFIQPYRSRNVLIEEITIVNSPMWEINPVLCRSVTVRGVSIRNIGVIDCRFDGVEKPNLVEAVTNLRLVNVRINGTVVQE
ncbi:MAG: hypothetical protein ABI818_04255 [Acidobacteriota bacterium]